MALLGGLGGSFLDIYTEIRKVVGREAETRVGRPGSEHSSPPGPPPHPKGCPSLLSVDNLCPSNQVPFCLGYFEVLGNPETSFKCKGYCNGLGEDSGEPAAGQGEAQDEEPLWRCRWWTELLACGGG